MASVSDQLVFKNTDFLPIPKSIVSDYFERMTITHIGKTLVYRVTMSYTNQA